MDAAAACGADAVGFVLYPQSPRAVTAQRAAELAKRLPPFVTPVLLLVNADAGQLAQACAAVPHALLQFHGDETPAACEAAGRAYIRAARIPTVPGGGGFDLLEYASRFATAQAVLLDALVEGYGGGGHPFDWTAFSWSHPHPNANFRLVLSGGLDAANATAGVLQVRPWAVDVSSGVELTGPDQKVIKGLKDPEKIARFVAAVRAADELLNAPQPRQAPHV